MVRVVGKEGALGAGWVGIAVAARLHISQLTQFMPPPETYKSEIGSQLTMCQVHAGAYVSLLAPEKTDYTACHPRKTTTCILHVVPITAHTHDRRKSFGKNRRRKEEKIKERKENTRKRKNEKGKARKDKKIKKRQDKKRKQGKEKREKNHTRN